MSLNNCVKYTVFKGNIRVQLLRLYSARHTSASQEKNQHDDAIVVKKSQFNDETCADFFGISPSDDGKQKELAYRSSQENHNGPMENDGFRCTRDVKPQYDKSLPDKKVSADKNVVEMSYGSMRFDSPQPHGKSKNKKRPKARSNFFDDQYFHFAEDEPLKTLGSEKASFGGKRNVKNNIFEEMYFGTNGTSNNKGDNFNTVVENTNNSFVGSVNGNEDRTKFFQQTQKIDEVSFENKLETKGKTFPIRKQQEPNNSNFFDDAFFANVSGDVSSDERCVAIDGTQSNLQKTLRSTKIFNDQNKDVNNSNFFDDVYFSNVSNDERHIASNDRIRSNLQSLQIPNGNWPEDESKVVSTNTDNFANGTIDKVYVNELEKDYLPVDSWLNVDKANTKALKTTKNNEKRKTSESVQSNKDISVDDRISKSNPHRNKNSDNEEESKPETAYDVAMQIRKEKSKTYPKRKVDSKGFNVPEDPALKFEYMTSDDVVNILYHNILYEDDRIIAINKPYGLASHGGPSIHHSVGKYLSKLSERVRPSMDTLHLVHRLDKSTTGVMLLAKSAQCHQELRGYFKRQEMVKVYFAITKGIPNPQKGIVDIPIAEVKVAGKVRMGCRTEGKTTMNMVARTEFNVLDSFGNAALVECKPQTGVKHQIRCHLSFGLNCPILGDHKYSHYSKFAPQKLHDDMLQRLKMRQPKVRHMPLHLHARSIIIPEFNNGRNVFIEAKVPDFFMKNLKALKLHIPKKGTY